MKMNKKGKALTFFLVLCMMVSLLPAIATVSLAATLDITAPLSITSADGSDVTVTMGGAGTTTANTITVESSFNGSITLQGLNISGGGSPISVQSGAVVTFILDGENTIQSTNNAAMSIAAGADVTILAKTSDASDTLTTTGAGKGAGIYVGIGGTDAGNDVVKASLNIAGGTINASSADNSGASGIGGNSSGNSNTVDGSIGDITISGGIVTARAGDILVYNNHGAGAGIGDGAPNWGAQPILTSGDITISGGVVTAYGGNVAKGVASCGAGIGAGGTAQPGRALGGITITGGVVKAYGGSIMGEVAQYNTPAAGIGIGGNMRNANVHNAWITITGGDVTAVGGSGLADVGAAGIGSSGSTGNNTNFACKITITGGNVTAIGYGRGAGIGTGGLDNSGGTFAAFSDIIITGGTVTAKGGKGVDNPALRGLAIGGGSNNSFRNEAYRGNIVLGGDIRVVYNGARRDIGGNPITSGNGTPENTNNMPLASLIVLPSAKLSYVEYDEMLDEYVPMQAGEEGSVEETPSFTGVNAGKTFWLNPSMPPSTLSASCGIARRLNVSANVDTAEVTADFSGYDTTVFGAHDTYLSGISAVPINPITLGSTGGAGNNFVMYLASSMNAVDIDFMAAGYNTLTMDEADMKKALINVPLVKTGTTPAPPTPEPPSFTLRQYESDPSGGIAWRIEGTADTVEHGQFANGDWWVVGPVTILEITPTATVEEGIAYYANNSDKNPVQGVLTKHGSMINPMGGSKGNTPQGFDSRVYRNSIDYSDLLNVGLYLPLEVRAGSSLVSARSYDATTVDALQLETTAVLTVLESAASPGDFRPPYMGNDKSLNWNKADLDYSKLRNLPTIPGNDYWSRPITRTPAYLAELFARPKMEYNGTWTGCNTHPFMNHRDLTGGNGFYGREMAMLASSALLSLNMDYTDEEKEALLINIVQYGIDIHGAADNGTIWYNDGGHNMGRKMILLFAAHMLDSDDLMEYVTAVTSDGRRYFQEDNSMLYVDQELVDRSNAAAWQNSSSDRPRLEYNEGMIGMPEWVGMSSSWNTPYRTTVLSQLGTILAAHLMGLKDEWDSKVLFDYSDRAAEIEIGRKAPFLNTYGVDIPVVVAHMWQIYRPNVSTDTDFTIYDENMGRVEDKAEFSVKYNGDDVSGAEIKLVVKKYDSAGGLVGTETETLLLPIDTAWTIDEIPWPTPGQPHEKPYPEATIQRGPSFTIEKATPLSDVRYEYYIETAAGTRISPVFHKAAELQDTTVSITSVMPNAANSSVAVNVSNPLLTEVTLIVAVYSGNKLIGVKVQTTSANGNVTVSDVAIPGTATIVKAMLWDDLQSMKPLCASVEVSGW